MALLRRMLLFLDPKQQRGNTTDREIPGKLAEGKRS